VVDLSSNAPGPFCTMVLGDLGADVIAVHQPPATQSASRLEATRATGGDATDEPFPALRGGPSDTLGRNKRSIGINLKDPRGHELFCSLVAGADVLVEEMRPGTADRLGVGYAAMHELNPRLVYCSISGFGQDGPYATLPGHDLSYLAQAGALALLTARGSAPVIPQNIVADYAGGGLVAAVGVLAALLARQRTGLGQHVDAALTDGVLYVLADLLSSWLGFGVTPTLGESAVSGALPSYSTYETGDGRHIAVACLEPWFFRALCDAVGRPELTQLFSDSSRRDELRSELAGVFATRTRDEWFAILAAADVPVGRVLGLDELAADPQVQARDMIVDAARPDEPSIRMVGVAPKLSDTPSSVRSAPFQLGCDTDAILTELGVRGEELTELRARGAIA
jgi:crotonobetainyl-CoA:carnitine CoA-transferase CaiB-like acyl-CoA transferase